MVDPLYYTGCLIVAVFALFLSLWYTIFLFMNVALKIDNAHLNMMMDGYLVALEKTPVSFFATIALVFTGMYFIICSFMGNVKLGLRFFIVSFYPLVPKETFVNSFMANCLVMQLWMVALTNYMCLLFKYYLTGTHIARIFNVMVGNMKFFGWMVNANFWVIFLIVWWFISFVYFLLKPFEKINLGNNVKHADLAAKH